MVCGTGMNCAAVGPDGRTVRFPALAELSGDFAPGGAWLGVRALGLALRAGDGRGAATTLSERVPAHLGKPDAEAVLTGIYTGAIPYARLFELARVLLDAAADGDALAREAADILADEVVAFVRAAVVRLDLQDEAVEVVLGGGIFDTTDAAFHAAWRPASTPPRHAPCWSASTLHPCSAPHSSGSTPSAPLRRRWPRSARPLRPDPRRTPTHETAAGVRRRRRPSEPPAAASLSLPLPPAAPPPARAAWRRPPVARRRPGARGRGPSPSR